MEQSEKKSLPKLTRAELYEYAEKAIMWIDPNDENEPDGRYWLACYRGCGEYRLFVKDGKILGALYGNFVNSRPRIKGYIIRPRTWRTAIEDVVSDRIGSNKKIPAYGSGTHFFLQDSKHKKYIATREYDVPDANGGFHHNIEIINPNMG